MPVAFVTGISGQDGGYLAEALTADGYEVHGLVRHPDPAVAPLLARTPGVHLHEGDLSDASGIWRVIDEIEPDEIYNLGGISSVAYSWDQPLLTAQVTGLGAGVLLDAAWTLQQRKGRPVRVLQASSAEIFGRAQRSPQDEQTPLRPVTPYGAAKAFAHNMVSVYRGRGLFACACILYNHESPRRPESFVTRKITAAAARIALGKQDSLALGSLTVRRDWGWAPDYVDAMIRAIRHDRPEDYVVATGVARSIEEFVAAAFERVGIADWRSVVTTDPGLVRPAETHEQVGNPAKARRDLGWAPTVDFAAMVALMVDHDVALARG